MKRTAVHLREDGSIHARILLGNPSRQGVTEIGNIAIFEGEAIVLYEVKRGRRYQGFLVRVGIKGHQKIQGIFPQITLLVTLHTAKHIRQLVKILKQLTKQGISLESLSDRSYARVNVLFQEPSVEDQAILNVLKNNEMVNASNQCFAGRQLDHEGAL